jgi:hypothetical protein
MRKIIIKNSSASALTWFALILLILGLLMMSPAGSFAVFILAALFAAAPALFGTKKIRLAAIVLLIAAIILAASQYPGFKNERHSMEKRAKISRIKPSNPSGHSYKNPFLLSAAPTNFFTGENKVSPI